MFSEASTTHEILAHDSRELAQIRDDDVELVVTSPPYPMIEMWDEVFGSMNEEIATALAEPAGVSESAFELMHQELDAVWKEVASVLAPNGVVCVNIGDATRSHGGSFHCFPNAARITQWFQRHPEFTTLPRIHWRKPTNKATKYMGSGMLPPNAYVTLENEYILLFRKGGTRSFRSEASRKSRYESAFFWSERNRWFSDTWSSITGIGQAFDSDAEIRERTAAYPLEIPYRLINMYSVHGDTLLDPFAGLGTTSAAAALSARNSIGLEIDPAVQQEALSRLSPDELREQSIKLAQERLSAQKKFVESEEQAPSYHHEEYDVDVMTKQERELVLPIISGGERNEGAIYLSHEPYAESD